MPDDAPHFDDQGRLIAPRYGDVYFSAEDGLAETRHVFLEGNELRRRFAAMRPNQCFTIGETGFGTGLNFLAAWQLFEQHAPADARLEFVSVEGEPLGAETMRRALSPWPELARCRDALQQQWGPIWPGMHRFRFDGGRVRLTLLVGEAVEALSSIDASVDAWLLDGFAPARNPDMWSEAVFGQVARLSVADATLATYTVAGHVRRGLEAVGFEIEKRPGFGTKRDMTVGELVGTNDQCVDHPQPVIVIGGSVAGAFAARSLAERGVSVTVVEVQEPVNGELPSLTPRVSVLQPKINDHEDKSGQWLREGYALAERWLRGDDRLAKRAAWRACGTFQAAHDARSKRRLSRFIEQFSEMGLCRWVEPEQTGEELGVALAVGGVVIERAGILRPAGLCAALLDHERITFRGGVIGELIKRDSNRWLVAFSDEDWIECERIVAAHASLAMVYVGLRDLDLQPIRGQVTLLKPEQAGPLHELKRAVFYGGYLTPAIDGMQTLGATFEPDYTHVDWLPTKHSAVCEQLARILPEQANRLQGLEAPVGWVGLRTTRRGRRASAEEIEPGLYASLGHGSHGIASAAAAGEHIASLVTSGVRQRETR